MKKLSIFLLAALVMGVASAFTTTTKMPMDIAYGNDGTWNEVDPSRIGEQFDCVEGKEYCLYQDPSFNSPLPGQTQNKLFIMLENK
ncbi:MAG: hypothetical protein V4450_00735 [Bacteroidota bacterium]